MKRFLLLFVLVLPRFVLGQASPYSNNVYPSQTFTASGQTGAAIPLSSTTVGGSYASGTATLKGSGFGSVTISILGSSDNGQTFFPLSFYSVSTPSSIATTQTASAPALYQFSLAGITHVEFVTSGTFSASSISLTLTASPNSYAQRTTSGGGVTGVTTFNGRSGAVVPSTGDYSSSQISGLGAVTGIRYGNGASADTAATAANVSSTLGKPSGVSIFGDSKTCYTGVSTPQQGYAYQVALAFGGPTNIGCTPGYQVADIVTQFMMAGVNGTQDTIVEEGTNDVTAYAGTTNLQQTYQRLNMTGLVLPMIMTPSLAGAGTMSSQSCTVSGGTAENTLRYGYGETFTGAGTLTCALTTQANPSFLLGYDITSGGTGTFTVTIDGTTYNDPITGSATFSSFGDGGAAFATTHGQTQGVATVRIPTTLVAGTHTVKLTMVGGTNTPRYVAVPPASFTSVPNVFEISIEPMNTAQGTYVSTYNGFKQANIAALASDGWPVKYVDTNTAITNAPACTGGATPPFTNCYADTLHMNATGQAIQVATINTVAASRETGNTTQSQQNVPSVMSSGVPSVKDFMSFNLPNFVPSAANWYRGIMWYDGGQGLTWFNTYNATYGATTYMPASAGATGAAIVSYTSGLLRYPTPADISVVHVRWMPNGAAEWYPTPLTAGVVAASYSSIFREQTGTILIGWTNPAAGPYGLAYNQISQWYNQDGRAATASTNYSSTTMWSRAALWNGTASVSDDWGWQNVPMSGSNPQSTYKLIHNYGGTGALVADMSAATGGVVATKFTTTAVSALSIGTAIASAATIAPVTPLVHVTGTVAIATITAPAACLTTGTGCTLRIIPDGAFTTVTTGNIAIASSAVVSRIMEFDYDPATAKWYPSY